MRWTCYLPSLVELLHLLTKGLSLELHRAKLEPLLLRYPIFSWLNASPERVQVRFKQMPCWKHI